jgi:undecaprenyl-phosphate 4-deoxy-4-formamido-L-arabinose transferase
MDLSVVIPVYRSAETLSTLLAELTNVLDSLELDSEIVLVDDASPDDSWAVILCLQERYPGRITAIELMKNFGQHNALICGLRHARGNYIVTIDDDMQNPPSEIPKLLAAIREKNLDLVYGVYDLKQHSRTRNLGTRIANAFFRTVFRLPVNITSCRIIGRQLVERVLPHSTPFVFLDGLFAWHTGRIGETPVEHRPRAAGRSSYSPRKLAQLAANLFTGFSLLPLELAGFLGLALTFAGILLAAYLALSLFWIEAPRSGDASLMAAALILGGIQLVCLGVLGEYVGRIHLNMSRRPQYSIREIRAPHAAGGQLAPPPRREGSPLTG